MHAIAVHDPFIPDTTLADFAARCDAYDRESPFFQQVEGRRPMKRTLMTSTMLVFFLAYGAVANAEENAEDFMLIHKIEIAFHQAGTTKNLDLMLSLFTNDATITSGG